MKPTKDILLFRVSYRGRTNAFMPVFDSTKTSQLLFRPNKEFEVFYVRFQTPEESIEMEKLRSNPGSDTPLLIKANVETTLPNPLKPILARVTEEDRQALLEKYVQKQSYCEDKDYDYRYKDMYLDKCQ